jgi:hypothetical protein
MANRRFLTSAWFGFMIAFWSWYVRCLTTLMHASGDDLTDILFMYAFPPLLSDIIAKDLHLSQNEVANSNIIGPLPRTYFPPIWMTGLLTLYP